MQQCTEVQMLCFDFFAVECRGKKILLPIFVDTGGQKTSLNKTSWQKLAPGVDVTHRGDNVFLRGTVHGVPTRLHFSQERTEGVNMVGQDWLMEGKLMLVADYNMDGCLVLVSDDITRSRFPELPVIGA